MKTKEVLCRLTLMIFCIGVSTANAQSIQSAEYFLDSDPGLGNGTQIMIVGGDSISISDSIMLNGIDPGFHFLYVRVLDSLGISSANRQLFYVLDTNSVSTKLEYSPIVQAEYFLDSLPPVGQGIPLPIPKGGIVNSSHSISISGLPLGTHWIGIRVKDSSGVWSLALADTFDVCTIDGPVAGFSTVRSGPKVSVIDLSQNAHQYFWNWGDGVVDTSSAPIHIYQASGVYHILQTVINLCDTVTLLDSVSISGIASFTPDNGGDKGWATIEMTGAGFTPQTSVKLTRAGYPDIEADTVIMGYNGKYLKAPFNLIDQPQGQWNIEIDIPGDTLQIIPDGFSIEIGSYVNPIARVVGAPIVRGGRGIPYIIEIENPGNQNMYGTPIFITITGDLNEDAIISFSQQLSTTIGLDSVAGFSIPADSIPVFLHLDEEIDLSNDSLILANETIGAFILPEIPGGARIQVPITIVPPNVFGGVRYTIETETLQPLGRHPAVNNNSYVNQTVQSQYAGECIENLQTYMLDIFLTSVAGFIPGVSCGVDITNLTLNTASYDQAKNSDVSPVANFGLNLLYTVGSCATSFTALKWVKTGSKIIKILERAESLATTFSPCFLAFSASHVQKTSLRTVTSFDPNLIAGPPGYTVQNYTGGLSSYSYVIMCENVDTAQAPAQEVLILDTLDLSVFDPSTFVLGPIMIRDTLIIPPPGAQEYLTEIDLTPNENIVLRISAKIDTFSGIARWQFLARDPISGNWPSDPFLGVLYPNVNPPEGDASVFFSVKGRDSLPDGQIINNSAHIYFDENLPIKTNNWQNALDFSAPITSFDQLDSIQTDTTFGLTWTGSDLGSMIRGVDIYMNTNGGTFAPYLRFWDSASFNFTGEIDSTYSFYVVGIDSVGNRESKPAIGEVTTKITASLPTPTITSSNGNTVFCANSDSLVLIASSGYENYKWSNGATTPSITVYKSGSYSVVVGDSTGLSNPSDSIHVVALPKPITPEIISDNGFEICSGDEITLASSISYTEYLWSTGDTTMSISVNTNGVFTVKGITMNGCSSSSSIPFEVQELPIPEKPVITRNANDSLMSSVVGTSYLWYSDSTLIQGASEISFLPTSSGSYQVRAISEDSCLSPLSEAFNYFLTSSDEQMRSHGIRVYPNPTSTVLHIEGRCYGGEEITMIMYDQQVRQVMFNISLCSETEFREVLDISSLPSGVYGLKLLKGSQVFHQIVVKN